MPGQPSSSAELITSFLFEMYTLFIYLAFFAFFARPMLEGTAVRLQSCTDAASCLFPVTRRRTGTPPLSFGVGYLPPPFAAPNSRRAPLWQRFAAADDAARAVWAARRRDHQRSTPSQAVDTHGTSSVHGRRPLYPPTCGRRRHAALCLAGGHVRRGHGRHEGVRTLARRLLHGAEPPLGGRSTAATASRRPPRMLAATGPGAWD